MTRSTGRIKWRRTKRGVWISENVDATAGLHPRAMPRFGVRKDGAWINREFRPTGEWIMDDQDRQMTGYIYTRARTMRELMDVAEARMERGV